MDEDGRFEQLDPGALAEDRQGQRHVAEVITCGAVHAEDVVAADDPVPHRRSSARRRGLVTLPSEDVAFGLGDQQDVRPRCERGATGRRASGSRKSAASKNQT